MNSKRLSDKEIEKLLDHMFPNGFAGPDVKNVLSPDGWEQSALKFIFHPTVEQSYKEYVQMMENISRISDDDDETEIDTFEEFKQDHKDQPIEPEKELWDLVGLCIYDIFSDNHEVISPEGKIADMGSMRGSAGFIANWIDKRSGADDEHYYLDFYMGTSLISGRADLKPVYRMIFQRLKELGYNWIYHFPQLYVLDVPKQDDPEDYNPTKAIRRDNKRKQLKKNIDEANRKAKEEARKKDPPDTVRAYHEVFGYFPEGWPPK